MDQIPGILVSFPLIAALAVSLAGYFDSRTSYPLTVVTLGGVAYLSLRLLFDVVADGPVSYRLGGWPPPFGIEYVIDHLNALVLAVVGCVSFLAGIASRELVRRELPSKTMAFYTLFILLVTGLLGMTITGDVFNLYVLVEISALAGYALIALGDRRGPLSAFNYIILGTVGASFYLLGVGHLYILTGSLNMTDLRGILPDLYDSRGIWVAFILILVGLWAKMAFLPLHGWLPNAYTYAPSAAGILVAPLMTKVSVYVMVRIMFSVFSAQYAFEVIGMRETIVALAVVAILGGSLLALGQNDFRKMLTYLIVAEVGYMVGGVWLANRAGITGAVLHILNDALMTLCLFLTAAVVAYKTGGHRMSHLKGLYRKMPVTMAAFTVGALSMIGVPPTAGFFSKWYLILGAVEGGQWHFGAALIFSSLVNAVLFFRVIEIGYFEPMPEEHGHHDHGPTQIDEAPLSMLVPLITVSIGLVVTGVFARGIVEKIIRFTVPGGM